MEVFSQQLCEQYPGRGTVLALRSGQRWLPLFVARSVARAVLARKKYDLIHLGDGMLAPIAGPLRHMTGKPVVITVHGQEVTRDLPMYRRALRTGFESPNVQAVAVSRYTASRFNAVFRRDARVISNGIEPRKHMAAMRPEGAAAIRSRFGLPDNVPLLLSVGRLVPRKGIEWFARHVLPSLPGDPVLVVVGSGPAERALRELARENTQIRMLGNLSDEAIAALHRTCDAFLAPNVPSPRKPEGYGIAPAEAAAAGMAVLVSRVEGLVDMAADFGLPTIPPGDRAAWVRAVIDATANPQRWRGTRPPRTWTDVAADYACLFDELVNRPKSSGKAAETPLAT